MKAILELHLTCEEGRENECARHLAGELRGPHWQVLVHLAAAIVCEHENRAQSTVVLVTGSAQAERVLADLQR